MYKEICAHEFDNAKILTVMDIQIIKDDTLNREGILELLKDGKKIENR